MKNANRMKTVEKMSGDATMKVALLIGFLGEKKLINMEEFIQYIRDHTKNEKLQG